MAAQGAQIELTVAAGKRLIAMGITAWEPFRAAREHGWIALEPGTTNAYVLEEMTGERVDKIAFAGMYSGVGGVSWQGKPAGTHGAVFRLGRRVEDLGPHEALEKMGPRDLFLKGANALDYPRGTAAVLVEASAGDVVGRCLATLVVREVRMVIPVGLEKLVPGDLRKTAETVRSTGTRPALYELPGTVFTEIEALRALAGVDAVAMSSGGMGGMEGSVRLLVFGTEKAVGMAIEAASAVRDEPPLGK